MTEQDVSDSGQTGSRRRRHRWFARNVKYPLEAALFFALLRLSGLLPVDRASALGAWIVGTFGPLVGASERSLRNLRLIYPQMPEKLRRQIAKDVWREVGSTAAEYAHLEEITDPKSKRVRYEGLENIKSYIDSGQPVIVASGHFSNFEVMQIIMARMFKKATSVVRKPNNEIIEEEIERLRSIGGGRRINKGPATAKALVQALEDGDSLAILVDQKLTKGLKARFLGHPAMTPTAAAAFAFRLKRPLFTVHLRRTKGANFVLRVDGPIQANPDASRDSEIARLTQEINDRLGEYIHAYPSSWFWLHRRWPKEVYEQAGV